MNVSSAIEIYSSVLGWVMYNGLWECLADTGLLYIPIICTLIRNWAFAWRIQGEESAEGSLRNNWLDLLAMMMVIALAGVPMFTLHLGDYHHSTTCSDSTNTGGNTGTLYDSAFAALNGQSAKIPTWWMLVLALSNGLNNTTVALIPCAPDLRTFAYRLDNTRITDPELRRQLELFDADCWQKARAKLIASHTTLPTNYAADDVNWMGSQYFQDTDGYYSNTNLNLSMRASEEIPGFAFNAVRDTEYLPGFIPAWGRPECKDWWDNSQSGIKPRLMTLIDVDSITQASIETGDVQVAKNAIMRKILEPERATLGRMLEVNSYGNNFGGDANFISKGVAGLGLNKELIFWQPKIYALRQAAPIGQAFILMGIFIFLPFILLFSAYSLEVLFTVTVAVFGIKFLTPIWTLAVWIDNHMMEALGIKWYGWTFTFDDDKATAMTLLSLVAMLMFVVLPIIWFMVIGWAGLKINRTLDSFNEVTNPVQSGANSFTKIGSQLASKKLLK